jgi:transcriptional regulator with XRE-family HTH domain
MARGVDARLLERLVGLSPGSINRLEIGLRPIGAGQLYRLACALGVDVSYFFASEAGQQGCPPAGADGGSTRQAKDAEEFARAYACLGDPAVRLSIRNLVELLADGETQALEDAEAEVATPSLTGLP